MERIQTYTTVIAFSVLTFMAGGTVAQSTSESENPYKTFDEKETERRKIEDFRVESKEDNRQGASRGVSLDSLPDLDESADPEAGWMTSMKANVAPMVTIRNRDKALFSHPSINLGHAVRINPPERSPVWITSRSWLTNKDTLCLMPAGDQLQFGDSGLLPSTAESSEAFRSDTSNQEKLKWYRQHKERCRNVEISASDRKTNLALLSLEGEIGGSGLKLGPKQLSEIDNRLYLFTLLGEARPAQLRQLPARPSSRALQFYWSIKTSANPGTPLSTAHGRLVGISAFQHPRRATQMLFIPSPFVRKGLKRLRRKDDDSN